MESWAFTQIASLNCRKNWLFCGTEGESLLIFTTSSSTTFLKSVNCNYKPNPENKRGKKLGHSNTQETSREKRVIQRGSRDSKTHLIFGLVAVSNRFKCQREMHAIIRCGEQLENGLFQFLHLQRGKAKIKTRCIGLKKIRTYKKLGF